jgi:hypothetical protein
MRADALFFRIVGPRVRAQRERLRRLDCIQQLYPVGSSIHAWVEGGASEDDFRQQLRSLGLEARVQRPSLHDVAIYELARSESSHGGG